MTAGALKRLYESNNPEGHFFDKNTMRFLGDTMPNFTVRNAGRIKVLTDNGIEEVEAWDLRCKNTVECGLYGHCAYFRKDNGQVVYQNSF